MPLLAQGTPTQALIDDIIAIVGLRGVLLTLLLTAVGLATIVVVHRRRLTRRDEER